jgi:hypothetical protein
LLSPGDRPIYGTIRIPDLSGVEGGCFPSITPRAFRRGRNNSQRAGSKLGNPPVCPRFHDIPARYRVGLSGRSRAWRRSGGSLREERRHPGDGRPEFCGDKKMRPILWRHKIRAEGSVSHTERRVPQPVWGVSRAKRPALGIGQPPAPPLPPSPHVLPGAFPRGLPLCPRGFPVGSPQAHAGFSLRILPPKADEAGPWDSPGRNLGVPTARPSRGSAPAWPGPLKAFSRDPSREAHGTLPGKRMGRAWGMGVVAEETGGEQRWAAREWRKPSRTV